MRAPSRAPEVRKASACVRWYFGLSIPLAVVRSSLSLPPWPGQAHAYCWHREQDATTHKRFKRYWYLGFLVSVGAAVNFEHGYIAGCSALGQPLPHMPHRIALQLMCSVLSLF